MIFFTELFLKFRKENFVAVTQCISVLRTEMAMLVPSSTATTWDLEQDWSQKVVGLPCRTGALTSP